MNIDIEDLNLPTQVKGLARWFHCEEAERTACKSPVTRSLVEKMGELIAVHPEYEQDDGDILLLSRLGQVALKAIAKGTHVPDAFQEFLDAALQEAKAPIH